jgi:hypothetical protein
MPKKKSKLTQKQINEGLAGYIMRTDARILAFEMTLGGILKLTPKQKEQLSKIQETNYKLIYQQMLERVEISDPALAARLLDGQDIYSGLV